MSIVYLIVSFFFATLGALIWRFKLVGLLANVDKTTIRDKDGLARWAGCCMLALAGLAIGVSIILEFVKTNRGELIACMVFMFATHMMMVVYLSGLHRYTN